MLDLSGFDWVVVAICAIMVGLTKTGIPGILILVVPLMASVFPARNSVGLLLGMLVLADVFAILYYRHHAVWKHLLRVLPLSMVGVIAGYMGLRAVNDEQFKPIIGGIVLVMLGFNLIRSRTGDKDQKFLNHWWFGAGAGFMAGVMTMMANTAGPFFFVYLLSMRLPKIGFMGTVAWYFFIVNWVKVPFSVNLNLMTLESVKLDLMMIPFIAIGAISGIFILKKIPQKVFNVVIQTLAGVVAVKLLLF